MVPALLICVVNPMYAVCTQRSLEIDLYDKEGPHAPPTTGDLAVCNVTRIRHQEHRSRLEWRSEL